MFLETNLHKSSAEYNCPVYKWLWWTKLQDMVSDWLWWPPKWFHFCSIPYEYTKMLSHPIGFLTIHWFNHLEQKGLWQVRVVCQTVKIHTLLFCGPSWRGIWSNIQNSRMYWCIWTWRKSLLRWNIDQIIWKGQI